MLTDKELVEALGGNEAVRQLCGFAHVSAVTNWFLEGRSMPQAWRMALEMKLSEKTAA